jgi:hypothetical protein
MALDFLLQAVGAMDRSEQRQLGWLEAGKLLVGGQDWIHVEEYWKEERLRGQRVMTLSCAESGQTTFFELAFGVIAWRLGEATEEEEVVVEEEEEVLEERAVKRCPY